MLTPVVALCEKWQGQKVYMNGMYNFNCEVCYMSGLSM